MAVLWPTITFPQSFTGNDLLRSCREDPESFCLGYVAGVTEGVKVGALGGTVAAMIEFQTGLADAKKAQGFCLPAGVTYSQLRDVVVKYLIANPEIRHNLAAPYSVTALGEAFPCH
ncbi:Rap1a/Tai family immunity protein [uncultured Roseibium sp.]|uniref:Rap1a/Tai family immunity protein n=1 Tax=uncultured Roseibium sp. TaxID=1936171 RepID=UPI002613439B|nr:Rap1a/Tai family immunity protein [uncultured Roseibium sp.]